MSNPSFRVLFIGDQPRCLRLLRRQQFGAACARRLADGLAGVKSRRVGLALMTLIAAFTLQAADPAFPQTTTLTSVAQLRHLTESNRYAGCSFRLEGVVCAVNPAANSVIVRDGSGDLEVQLNLREHPLQPGQEVLLEGGGDMVGRRLNLLTGAPLVDNDGVHGMVEVAGTVFLKAGRHPIRLDWFNYEAAFGLEVYYRGPELRHQKIPGSVLFREQTDSVTGTTNQVNGLDYRYYEGTNWEWLPDISRLKPVKTGTAANFNVSVISQTNSVCLEFAGYIEVARDGLYTFSTSSDDGSRLFVGEPSFQIKVVGSGQAPAPRPLAISQTLSKEEDYQWSEVRGTVTFVSEQPDGCDLELSSETARMRVTVADNSGGAPPFLLNSQVRVRGICEGTYSSSGQKVAGAMMVAGWDQIKLTRVAAEYWMASPLTTIGNLLTNSLLRTNAAAVRVRGKLREATPDNPLQVEDETGWMWVEGIEPSSEAVGSQVELLGKPNERGTNVIFMAGFCREMAQGGGTNSQMLPLLTTAKQIQYLSAAEAKRKYPVRLRGVVTSTMAWHNSFTLQDATRGIWVDGIGGNRQLRLGEFVEVEGVTDPSQFAPIVISSRVVPLGLGQMPEPVRPNRDQLLNGSLDAQYVEVQGVVTAVEPGAVALLTLAGKYRVLLPEMYFTDFRPYENALVRIKGCLYASWDEQTYQIKIGELRLFNASISVDELAPADLFAAPEKSVKDLLLFDPRASVLNRVKVVGQIVHKRAGEYFMMNGTNGLRFFLETPAPLQIGDFVEVAGFPMLGNASPVLQDAVVRQTGKASLPEARRLAADTLFNSDFDATVVQVESKLVGVRSVPSGQEFVLQTGMRTFVARLDNMTNLAQPIPVGSRLRLTGVYAGRGGDRSVGRSIDSFELLLNSPSDVKVLERPSWWTIGHTLVVVGALAAVLLLALAWIMGLRRQVNLKTKQLRGEIEERKQAQTELAYERDLLHSLLDNASDLIYFKDTKSRIVRCSKSFSERSGLSPEKIVGKSDFDLYLKEHAQPAFEDEQEIIRTGKPLLGKLEKESHPNGRTTWVLTTKMPWRNTEGKIIGTFGISKDVTKLEETEEALARERLLLRTLLDNLPDAVYAKDTAGRKTMANPADLKNLRCKNEAEAVGKSDFDLFPKDVAEKFWADDQKVIQGQPVLNREEFFFDETGQKQWLLTSKLPLRDPNGKIIGLVGIGHDITKHKLAEEVLRHSRDELEKKVAERTAELSKERRLLRTLIDNLPDLVFVKDAQSRFVTRQHGLRPAIGGQATRRGAGQERRGFCC